MTKDTQHDSKRTDYQPELFGPDESDVEIEKLLLDPVGDDAHPAHQDLAHHFDATEAAALRHDVDRAETLPKGYYTAGGKLLVTEGVHTGWINCAVADTEEIRQ